jgi:hypothetical protein
MAFRVFVGISHRDGNFLAGMLIIMLKFITQQFRHPSRLLPHQTLLEMPSSLQTIMNAFPLDGDTTTYAVCPTCHANFAALADKYPQRCTHNITPELQCEERLLDDRGDPLKTFTRHKFGDYLGGLFSRAHIERYLSKPPLDLNEVNPRFMCSPFHAKAAREFVGPDQKGLFMRADDASEARLLFMLCLDWFNAGGMRMRGPSTSVGIIALACLNLPLELRYKSENLFLVGIIPGPTEPSLTQVNHYTNHVVDDMLVAWHSGMMLSKTALYPNGRLVRSALGAVVCDLPAARKTAALAPSISKIFCNVCDCWDVRDHKGDIIKDWRKLRGRTDYEKWRLRDVEEMRRGAEQWRDAATVDEQDIIFQRLGVRWSPLWRLPYWNPVRMLVVDPMHALLEGLAKFHYLNALCFTDVGAKAKPPNSPAFSWRFSVPDLVDEPLVDVVGAGDFQEDFAPETSRPESAWNKKQYNQVLSIHSALTAELSTSADGVPSDEGQTETRRTAAELEAYLEKRLAKALDFVLKDLHLTAVSQRPGRKPIKQDIARALVEWVCSIVA